MYDHLLPPMVNYHDYAYPHDGLVNASLYEVWTTLSALATVTSKVRLGCMTLCNPFRYPSVVAKMTSTLDNISNGRIEVGIGAGWFKTEFVAFGIPFSEAAARIQGLREGIHIIKKMWTEEEVTFKGKYYSVESVYNNPKPIQKPHPPLWVGGTDSRVMKIVAEFADGWNIAFYPSNTPEGYSRKVEALEGYCKEVGRDPKQLRKSWMGEIVMGDTKADVEREVTKLKPADMTNDQYKIARIMGTPDEVITQIQTYVKLGASYLMIRFPHIETLEPLRSFAEQVMSRTR
jgi:alkanesulfonate monooxygenase SsuD/methylene tetrahydromethanopterin reductase-like flavin-dependent oxidoreductase (luciferase family)